MEKDHGPADPGVWDRLAEIGTAAVIVQGEAVDRGRYLEAIVFEQRKANRAMALVVSRLARAVKSVQCAVADVDIDYPEVPPCDPTKT